MRSKSRVRRFALWAVAGVAAGTLCYVFPLFHVVPLRTAQVAAGPVSFQPSVYAREFWDQRLMKAAGLAPDANAVLSAIHRDSQAAKKQYGRTSGLGGPTYYFVSGDGKVTQRDKGSVTIHLEPGAANEELVIDIGEIFGNGVRDGTGLLNVNDFPNSRDFNELSAELDKLVETRVLPALRQVNIGSQVHFAGIAEVTEDAPASERLHIVPVVAEVR